MELISSPLKSYASLDSMPIKSPFTAITVVQTVLRLLAFAGRGALYEPG